MIPRPNPYSVRGKRFEKLAEAEVLPLLGLAHQGHLAKEEFAAQLRPQIESAVKARVPKAKGVSLDLVGWIDLFKSIATDTPKQEKLTTPIWQDNLYFAAFIKRQVSARIARELELLDPQKSSLDLLEQAPSKVPRNHVSLTELYIEAVARALTNAAVEFEKLDPTDHASVAEAGLLKTVLEGHRAKEKLTEAFLPFVDVEIGKRLREGEKIGIYDRSEAFAHIAKHIYEEMSRAAKESIERNIKLSTCIVPRVARRMSDIFRKKMAKKRSAGFASPDEVNEVAGDDEEAVHGMILQTAVEELYNALDELPERERLVVLSSYGLEFDERRRYSPGESLTMKAVAEKLQITEEAARNAFRRGMYKLVQGLGGDDDLNPFK